jgi:hypothetical protein
MEKPSSHFDCLVLIKGTKSNPPDSTTLKAACACRSLRTIHSPTDDLVSRGTKFIPEHFRAANHRGMSTQFTRATVATHDTDLGDCYVTRNPQF